MYIGKKKIEKKIKIIKAQRNKMKAQQEDPIGAVETKGIQTNN